MAGPGGNAGGGRAAQAHAVPEGLSRAIHGGRCVAFVGAGFSAAAGLPSWKQLLQGVLEEARGAPVPADYVRDRIARGSAHALDEAAQALEDALGREAFYAALRRLLNVSAPPQGMRRRIELLKGVPFRAVLTTNYDEFLAGMVPSRRAYRLALRPDRHRWWEDRYWTPQQDGAFTLKLHGDIARPETGVVITRRDYRQRLYADAAYSTFLRAMLATCTVLYLGFSFEDAYLNELRSEILELVGHHEGDEVMAYAVMNDVPEPAVAHFRRHEGIEILTYDTGGGRDFSGFDRWLEAIHRATNPVVRFGRYLSERRILWLDPHPENNREAFEFLSLAARQAGEAACGLETVACVEAALERLADTSRGPYHLVITHWGEGRGRDRHGAPVPAATALLEAIRRRDLRVPVIVFAAATDADARKRTALSLGAADYCLEFAALFRRIESVLAPARGPAGHEA